MLKEADAKHGACPASAYLSKAPGSPTEPVLNKVFFKDKKRNMHAIPCISSAVQKWSRQGVNIFTEFFARSAASQDLFKQSQSRLRFLSANVGTDKTNVILSC